MVLYVYMVTRFINLIRLRKYQVVAGLLSTFGQPGGRVIQSRNLLLFAKQVPPALVSFPLSLSLTYGVLPQPANHIY